VVVLAAAVHLALMPALKPDQQEQQAKAMLAAILQDFPAILLLAAAAELVG
jgi:hypothetical protein